MSPIIVSGGGGGAGAVTQISSSVLAVTTASFNITAIAQTFNALRLLVNAHCDLGGGAGTLGMRLNGDNSASYDFGNIIALNGGPTQSFGTALTQARIGAVPGSGEIAQGSAVVDLVIPSYTGTTFYKTWAGSGGRKDADAAPNFLYEGPWGSWRNTAAVTTLTVFPIGASGTAANFRPGSACFLYGIT